MIINKRIDEIDLQSERKSIINHSLLNNIKETNRYSKIEINNNFTKKTLIIECDNKTNIDLEKLIFYSTKDCPHSKIFITNVQNKENILNINIIPMLTTA